MRRGRCSMVAWPPRKSDGALIEASLLDPKSSIDLSFAALLAESRPYRASLQGFGRAPWSNERSGRKKKADVEGGQEEDDSQKKVLGDPDESTTVNAVSETKAPAETIHTWK